VFETSTTVGYGDIFPKTFTGKILSMICAILGTLIIALPVAIFINKFSQVHEL